MSNPLGIEPVDVFLRKNTAQPIWLWDNQLALGCISILVGQPKAGKSIFIKNFIRAVSVGADFLGKKTLKSSVLYFAFEDHEAMLQRELRNLEIVNQGVHVKIGISEISEDEKFAAIEEYCNENQINCIVIDPLVYFFNIGDTNDYQKVYSRMSKIKRLAKTLNCHIVIIHHSNKGTSDSAKQILGSNAFFASCDGAIILNRNKDNTSSIKSELRYGESIFDPLCFRYDKQKQIIFEGAYKQHKENEKKSKLLQFLEKNSDSNFEVIRTDLSISDQLLNTLLSSLIEQQIVQKKGKGTKGAPHTYSLLRIEYLGSEENNVGAVCN